MYQKPTWVRFVLVAVAMLFLCSCKPKDIPGPDGSTEDTSGTSAGGDSSDGSNPGGLPWDPSDPTQPGDPSASGSDGSSGGPGGSTNGGSSTTSGGTGGNPDSSTDPTNPGQDPPPEHVYVTPFGMLNTTDKTINSHEGDEGASSLELDYRGYTEVTPSTLTVSAANYPRIKKLSNGQYILFWHNNSVGANIFYTRSFDLKNWEPVKKVFEATPITVNGEADERSYCNGDAIVLQNGDLMVVASFRSKNHFRKDNAYNGIMMRKSSDNGKTWSEEQVIYQGSNWEPQILQLPSGEIQVYFTHSGAKSQMQIEMGWIGDDMVPSSGTAIARSYDNGKTWKSNIPGSPYAGYAISQRYTDTVKGIKVFTDQMPCAVLLNKYNTIAMVVESKTKYGTNNYTISTVYSDDNWSYNLGIDEEGPSDKQKDMWKGSSPYIKQFPSGETVMSYGNSSNFLVRLGDAKARTFYTPYLPFGKGVKGCWGSLEPDGSHVMIGTFPKSTGTGNAICIGRMNLNHTVVAGNMTPTIDGDNGEWSNNTEAFFVGSESQAQASVRLSYDKDNVYVLVERLDVDLRPEDTVSVYLNPDSQGLGESSLRLTVGTSGLQQTARYSGGRWTDTAVSGARGEVLLRGTVGDSSDQDEGYAVEVVIPRAALQANASTLRCALVLYNQDKGTSRIEDSLDSVTLSQPTSWLKVRLG